MSETQKEPNAADLGITPEDMEMTPEEYDMYAKQAKRMADEATIEGEPGTAAVFNRLIQLLKGIKTTRRNSGLDN